MTVVREKPKSAPHRTTRVETKACAGCARLSDLRKKAKALGILYWRKYGREDLEFWIEQREKMDAESRKVERMRPKLPGQRRRSQRGYDG